MHVPHAPESHIFLYVDTLAPPLVVPGETTLGRPCTLIAASYIYPFIPEPVHHIVGKTSTLLSELFITVKLPVRNSGGLQPILSVSDGLHPSAPANDACLLS